MWWVARAPVHAPSTPCIAHGPPARPTRPLPPIFSPSCAAHRYPDQHVCTFDFKGHDRALLAKQNPKLVAAKLNGDTL